MVSRDLEHALVGALVRGQVEPDIVPKSALSKEGQAVVEGVEFLRSKKTKARRNNPISRQDILIAAGDAMGGDKDTLRPYIVEVMDQGGEEVSVVLQALMEQQALQGIINEASTQIAGHTFDPSAFKPHFEVKKSHGLAPASTLLVNDKLPPIPSGVPVSLPMLQAASGGIFGVWVIGGKSGVGKSTLGWQLTIEVARTMPALVYDMENGETTLLYRIGKALGGDIQKVKEATKQIYIRRNIRTLTEDLAAVPAPALIVVDSLQKLPTKIDQRRGGIDHWLNRLESLKDQGYSVLIISELNGLGGFKETGEIEYTADFGMQLWPRDEGVEVQVLKNRHRPELGHICDLSRVNGWWFQEADDLGTDRSDNAADELGL